MPSELATRRLHTNCIECDHPIAALSVDAVNAAIRDHVEYVNARLDRATDIHFRDDRLSQLIES